MANKSKIIQGILMLTLLLVSTLAFASALTVTSIDSPVLKPGDIGVILIELDNDLDEDVEDVSVKLNLQNLPFNPIGSSEASTEEIEEDKDESFAFRIKAANNVVPGDYQIPFTIEFTVNGDEKQRSGSLGITVKADPELTYSVSTTNPIVNQQDKLTLRIVNKGFADAKFLTIRIVPNGFTLLSDSEVYIGKVDSDDFETAIFDVIYKSENPTLSAFIEYRNFDNQIVSQTIDLPLDVFTMEEAIELGIAKKNNTPLIIGGIIAIIILWTIYRSLRKYLRKRKNSRE
jgi:hypothetical protein